MPTPNLNPFQQWLYDFEMHLFTPRTTEGLIYNYYRRFKHSLMPQKEKPCIKTRGVKTFEQNKDVYIFLVLANYIFFSFSTDLQRLQKILTSFPEDKISYIYPDLHIKKRFHPPSSYLIVFLSGASVSVWTFCNICIRVPQLSSVWNDGSQNHTTVCIISLVNDLMGLVKNVHLTAINLKQL